MSITMREERGRKVQNEEEKRREKKIPTTEGRLLSRGVYRQEFVANEVKKSWSWS